MPLYFITGNAGKFAEASAIIPDLEQLKIDLPEIQSLDSQAITTAKLESAFVHHEGPFIVEDVSLELECLGHLPGPLIKWFIKDLGLEGIYKLAHKYHNYNAINTVTYGYAQNRDNIAFFASSVKGQIVAPRGERNFGFDPIFQPAGSTKTQAEMTIAEKNQISARRQALEQLARNL